MLRGTEAGKISPIGRTPGNSLRRTGLKQQFEKWLRPWTVELQKLRTQLSRGAEEEECQGCPFGRLLGTGRGCDGQVKAIKEVGT